ncbi:sodium:dicarboxylate symporter [Listeria aquatica FSL S10-1188]|uniref:Sodium:dicarboxylate symporter n=1 Tax=Listeria aquatica FSL S10-1188 TaxID=1265818 RepID=W7BAD0_9LIST|nr:sodium:dicarboxylate symporter [Listeria aquatica FSL S10-1188]
MLFSFLLNFAIFLRGVFFNEKGKVNMKILRNYAFTICLLSGIILGGIAGVIFGEGTVIVKPIGDIFLNLMFVVIVPLVFFKRFFSYRQYETNGTTW